MKAVLTEKTQIIRICLLLQTRCVRMCSWVKLIFRRIRCYLDYIVDCSLWYGDSDGLSAGLTTDKSKLPLRVCNAGMVLFALLPQSCIVAHDCIPMPERAKSMDNGIVPGSVECDKSPDPSSHA